MPAVVRTLLASRLSERVAQDHIASYRPGPAWRRHAAFVEGLVRVALWCLRPGPRILHVHTAVRGSIYRKAVIVALGRLLHRPVVLQLHAGAGDIAAFDERLGPWRRRLVRGGFAMADRVLSVSAAGAAEVERRWGAHGVLVVPNAAPPVAAATAAGSDDGTVRVLFLGGFADPAKGGAVMLQAIEPLLAADPRIRIDVAGPGAPPAALLKRTRDEQRVRWLGWLDEPTKDASLRSAGLVIFPSLTEGLPMALLEAMAYGRAIVASRTGGMAEVLTDDDAVLVPPGDAEALAGAVQRLAADAGARGRLGRRARERASHLSEDEVAGRLLEVYAELLRQPPTAA